MSEGRLEIVEVSSDWSKFSSEQEFSHVCWFSDVSAIVVNVIDNGTFNVVVNDGFGIILCIVETSIDIDIVKKIGKSYKVFEFVGISVVIIFEAVVGSWTVVGINIYVAWMDVADFVVVALVVVVDVAGVVFIVTSDFRYKDCFDTIVSVVNLNHGVSDVVIHGATNIIGRADGCCINEFFAES